MLYIFLVFVCTNKGVKCFTAIIEFVACLLTKTNCTNIKCGIVAWNRMIELVQMNRTVLEKGIQSNEKSTKDGAEECEESTEVWCTGSCRYRVRGVCPSPGIQASSWVSPSPETSSSSWQFFQ